MLLGDRSAGSDSGKDDVNLEVDNVTNTGESRTKRYREEN